MSEKKSPPHKEKVAPTKSLQLEGKTNKRKLVTPTSPCDDDDKRNHPAKRKRPIGLEGSPEHVGMSSPRSAGSRLNVPLSERQQMALLMRMADESSAGDISPKSPSSGGQIISSRRTPADKKVNKRNERGEAPLHMAAKRGDYKQTKRLLKAGASVNMKDYAGWTALHEACNSGNLRVARYLMKAGADVNVQGFEDDTPLHDAAAGGHTKLVQLLLRYGANPLQANLTGKTPVDVASGPEIESILSSNQTTHYTSESDENSEASSSDSIFSKEEDDDFKSQIVKNDGISSGSHITSCDGTPGLTVLHQSVLPSRDKIAASPRLFIKLQQKKTSPASLATNEDHAHASEWNVLPNVSENDVAEGKSNRPNRDSDDETWNRVVGLPGSHTNRAGLDADCPDSTHIPNPVRMGGHVPLERTATEPFTPRGIETIGTNDIEENNDVFSNNTCNFNNLPVCSSSNTFVDSKPHSSYPSQHNRLIQQSNVHIPGVSTCSHVSVGEVVQLSTKSITTTATSCSFSSSTETSSHVSSSHVSSTTSSSQTSACQFSFVSSTSISQVISTSTTSLSSSISSSSTLGKSPMPFQNISSGINVSSALPLSVPSSGLSPIRFQQQTRHLLSTSGSNLTNIPYPPAQRPPIFAPFTRAKVGGSIVTGLSDRAVAASSVLNLQIAPSVSNSIPQPHVNSVSSVSTQKVEISSPPTRTDTSSITTTTSLKKLTPTTNCDFPPKNDTEDSNLSQPDDGSRPSTPKVPPLKIIMPPKAAVPVNDDSQSLTKPALPYVLNPTRENSNWCENSEGMQLLDSTLGAVDGVLMKEETNSPSISRNSPLPRPSSRAGSGIGLSSDKVTDLISRNLDIDEGASRESDGRNEQNDEKKPTRTLRSHTAQLQKEQQNSKPSEKNDSQEVKEEGDNLSTTRSQKGYDSATDDSSFPPRKRKLRNKNEQQTQVTVSCVVEKVNMALEKPPNPYETYLNLRRQIASRHRSLCNVTPKPPNGFKDYLMVNCTYILQGNATSTLSVPMLPPPNLVKEPMREFFIQQERERYRLRLQHVIEREKLMLSIEQEILREHARAARALANQSLPFSVCTILREEEIYNLQELDQVEDREKTNRSRYNGRQFYSWLQDVNDKYEKIKRVLLLRHHHEADSLYAMQKLDWEWKMKECGLCDHRITPVIDDLHVPMVNVNDEFDLRPAKS